MNFKKVFCILATVGIVFGAVVKANKIDLSNLRSTHGLDGDW